jgi:hypothetical protein
MSLAPYTEKALDGLRRTEEWVRSMPEVPIRTHHVIHGGQYHRTIKMPRGTVLISARIKIPTTVVLSGTLVITSDGETSATFDGYHVLPASANRKQAYYAVQDSWITMSFPTKATTVEEAEEEFTDDADQLLSRTSEADVVIITGE